MPKRKRTINRKTPPIGQQLRELRQAAGFSQVELAERAGCQQCNISALERGQRPPQMPIVLMRLADVLGKSLLIDGRGCRFVDPESIQIGDVE